MNRLTVAFVRKVKPTDRLRRYGDGNGLYLLVKPGPRGGGKSWVQRIAINGTRRDLGLGSAELVTLAEAREAAYDNRRRARAGADPRAGRRRVSPTFAEAAEEVIAMHRPAWKPGGGSEAQWRSTLERYAYPRIRRKPVHAIDAADLMAVLAPLWIEKHATARRLRLHIGQVMKWAIGQGHRTDNPAGDAVGAALPKVDARPVHQRALPHAEVGAALRAVRRTGGAPAAKLAFEFLVLTAARSGEVRKAIWDEMDLDGAVWTLPAARMKAGREHRVPLSPRALEVLREAATLRRGGLVFPAPSTGRALTVAALGGVVRARRRRRRAARVPFLVPGLGGGVHRRAARGVRARACARQPRPGRGRVPAHRPVRPAPGADDRLGRVRRLTDCAARGPAGTRAPGGGAARLHG